MIERTLKIKKVSAAIDTFALELAQEEGLSWLEFAEAMSLSTSFAIHHANVEARRASSKPEAMPDPVAAEAPSEPAQ